MDWGPSIGKLKVLSSAASVATAVEVSRAEEEDTWGMPRALMRCCFAEEEGSKSDAHSSSPES
jgi:hypothetical protein